MATFGRFLLGAFWVGVTIATSAGFQGANLYQARGFASFLVLVVAGLIYALNETMAEKEEYRQTLLQHFREQHPAVRHEWEALGGQKHEAQQSDDNEG